MPLPCASAPQLRKTHVIRVDCYYLGGKAGTIELYDLHVFDFKEAATAHPADWALVEPVESLPQFKPYRMPVGPHAPKIIDKRNIPNWPTPEQMSSPAPPMFEMIPMHMKRLPGGGSLIPRRG
jgi:hypothetical protein